MRASQQAAGGSAHAARTPRRAFAAWSQLHEHTRAGLLIAVAVLAYLWPVLLAGRMLSPVAALYEFAPWRGFTPADISSFNNPLLIDVPGAVLPWRYLARDLIHAGVFPAWNPYALAGTPLFANPQVAWLSPFMNLQLLLPLVYAIGASAAVKLLVAGMGSYLLVRELRLGFWPGVLAGVSFAFCAFNIVWLTHAAQVSVAVTLPWTVWLVERVVRGGSAGAGLGLVVASAFAFSGGHPGTELIVMTATALYAVTRATVGFQGMARADRLRRLGMVAAALMVGALLLAVSLVPGAEEAQDTIGQVARAHGGSHLAASNLPLGALRTIAFPDWWGRPSELQFGGPSNYNERTMYAGVVALLLAALALTSLQAWRRKLPFVLIGGVALAVTFRVPGFFWLATNLPMFEKVSYQRIVLLLMFAISILAAFGLQALLDAPWGPRRASQVVIEAAVLGLAAIASLRPSLSQVQAGLERLFTRAGQADDTLLAVTSVGWWLVFVAGLALALVALHYRPQARGPIAAGIVLLAALDMLHFAHGYQPMGPPTQVIPPRTPVVRYLQHRGAEGRVAGIANALYNDWTTVYHLRDVRGHDVPQPSLRYFHLWRLATPGQRAGPPLVVGELNSTGVHALGVLGTRFLVYDPQRAELRHARTLPDLSPSYRGSDAVVLENRSALPRALVAPRVHIVTDEQATLARIAEPDFVPRREAIVERGEPGAAALAGGGTTHGRVRVVRDRNAEVVLRATLDRRGLVVLDDSLTPGWQVHVDGHAAPVIRVDSILRGVAVPAGTHTISWTYAVPGLGKGLALSGIGLAALAGWGLLALRGRNRRVERKHSREPERFG